MGRVAKLAHSKPVVCALLVVLLMAVSPGHLDRVYAAELIPRSLRSSDSGAGVSGVSYSAAFTVATAGPVGSVAIMFCSNTPLLDQPCDAPVGFDASSTVIVTQFGMQGFTVYSGSTANVIILTRPPAIVNAGTPIVFDFTNVINPSNPGPLFARFYTYPSSDASGPETDGGGMALYISSRIQIDAEVPPYITFCIGENISGTSCSTATEPFSDMGSFSPTKTAAAQHQMVVATNAGFGYSVFLGGSPMTSGNDVISPMSGGLSTKGASQFGLNLRANSAPVVGQDSTGPGLAAVTANYDQPDHFRFNAGDAVVTNTVPDDYRKFTVSYIVNVPAGQPGGVYATTLLYVCLANF